MPATPPPFFRGRGVLFAVLAVVCAYHSYLSQENTSSEYRSGPETGWALPTVPTGRCAALCPLARSSAFSTLRDFFHPLLCRPDSSPNRGKTAIYLALFFFFSKMEMTFSLIFTKQKIRVKIQKWQKSTAKGVKMATNPMTADGLVPGCILQIFSPCRFM